MGTGGGKVEDWGGWRVESLVLPGDVGGPCQASQGCIRSGTGYPNVRFQEAPSRGFVCYLFMAGPSLLCTGFLSLRQAGATLGCGARRLTVATSPVAEPRV